MPRNSNRILIIGAGIAGLTSAIALHRTGHDVRVFERYPQVEPLGAGLVLWSNAVGALRAIGLEHAVHEIGNPLEVFSILDAEGRILAETDAGAIAQRIGTPTVAVDRGDLTSALLKALPEGVVQTHRELTGFQHGGNRVIATFADGTQESGDLLIGADGLRSTVRAQIHGPQAPRYAGYTAWRAISENPGTGAIAPHQTFETWGNGLRFGWVPLTRNRVYWFAVKNAPENQTSDPRGHKAELLELFGDWSDPIRATLENANETEIMRHDIYDRPPITSWGIGPVTLAGDAAHPMTPNTGQGAAQAIEDAVVLADTLSRYRTIDGALRAYETQRIPRTKMITEVSHQLGQASQIAHPHVATLRNAIVRWVPDSISSRQIGSIVDWKAPKIEKESR
jgi:FAD-dependent urate hydroxylase